MSQIRSAGHRFAVLIVSIGGLSLAFLSSLRSIGSDTLDERVEFVDVARRSGLDFSHDNAATEQKYLIETMGSGCGWIDFDNDGLLDLYLVNGAATSLYKPKTRLRSALFRNNGDGSFSDVTEKA